MALAESETRLVTVSYHAFSEVSVRLFHLMIDVLCVNHEVAGHIQGPFYIMSTMAPTPRIPNPYKCHPSYLLPTITRQVNTASTQRQRYAVMPCTIPKIISFFDIQNPDHHPQFHHINARPIAAASTTTVNPLISFHNSDADDCTSPQHLRVYVTLLCRAATSNTVPLSTL